MENQDLHLMDQMEKYLQGFRNFGSKEKLKDDYEYIYISDYNRAGYKHSKEFSVGRYGISVDTEGNAHSISGTIPAYNKTIAAFRTFSDCTICIR